MDTALNRLAAQCAGPLFFLISEEKTIASDGIHLIIIIARPYGINFNFELISFSAWNTNSAASWRARWMRECSMSS